MGKTIDECYVMHYCTTSLEEHINSTHAGTQWTRVAHCVESAQLQGGGAERVETNDSAEKNKIKSSGVINVFYINILFAHTGCWRT